MEPEVLFKKMHIAVRKELYKKYRIVRIFSHVYGIMDIKEAYFGMPEYLINAYELSIEEIKNNP